MVGQSTQANFAINLWLLFLPLRFFSSCLSSILTSSFWALLFLYSYLTIYITAFFLTQVTAAFPSLVPRFVTLIAGTIVFAVSPHKTCLFLSVFLYFCVFLYRADGMSHVYLLLNSSHHFTKLKLYF